jgi:cell division septal protein FtsQ
MSELIQFQPHSGWGGETEFLRRKNNSIISKEKRKRAIRLTGLHLFLIFSVLIAIALLVFKMGEAVLTWDKLRVKEFVLHDKPLYRTEELKNVLRRFNVNILTLDFSDVRNELLKFSEVKDVSLSRKLPSTVEIRFILRKPVFQVAINGKFNIIDTEGVILNTGNVLSDDLIRIQDIDGDVNSLVPYLPELSDIKTSIDYVSYKMPYGIALKLKGRKELFYPGDNDFARKISSYIRWKSLPELKNYDITKVDLRFKDRFYFEYETEVNN